MAGFPEAVEQALASFGDPVAERVKADRLSIGRQIGGDWDGLRLAFAWLGYDQKRPNARPLNNPVGAAITRAKGYAVDGERPPMPPTEPPVPARPKEPRPAYLLPIQISPEQRAKYSNPKKPGSTKIAAGV